MGYTKRIRETSFTSHFEIGLHIYGVVNHTIYAGISKRSQRGGLENRLPTRHGGSNPSSCANKKVYSLRVDLFLLPQSEGTNPLSRSETGSSHTAGTEHTTRNRVFAVSALRGDVSFNLYQSGTISTNLTPSSIPLFQACTKRNITRT